MRCFCIFPSPDQDIMSLPGGSSIRPEVPSMSFRKWFEKQARRCSPIRNKPKKPAGYKQWAPRLEALEDRTLMSVTPVDIKGGLATLDSGLNTAVEVVQVMNSI